MITFLQVFGLAVAMGVLAVITSAGAVLAIVGLSALLCLGCEHAGGEK